LSIRYGKLFDFLIGQICTSLSAGMAGATPEIKVKKARRASLVGMDMAVAADAEAQTGAIIGVLDIFGFEFFETNSFEQLCINYTNEKLQFHFNDFIFTLEQAEYAVEGLDVSQVSFTSNALTLALIEAPACGLLAMLDEEVVMPKGSDEGFLNKVLQRHGAAKELARPKAKALNSRLCFGVVHFAGEVQYNVTAFLEKNCDSLLPGLESVCGGASDAFTAALFKKDRPAEGAAGGDGGAPGRRPLRRGEEQVKTLAAGFKLQMSQLMGALGSCQPHFIRCMKPNSQKVGGLFDAPLMMGQLGCAGVLEVCRIRQVGYPSRRPFAQFEHRYGALAKDGTGAGVGAAAAGGTAGTAASATALCERLVAQGALGKEPAGGGGGWAVGKTKVFLRANAQAALDLARDAVLESFVVRLQCGSRRYIARKVRPLATY
jgi:myosin heavy subunit